MKIQKSILYFSFFLLFASLIFFSLQANKTLSQNSDALAIRVIPNPNHYSASRWFENQGFSGAKQSIVVDGYEAIRVGRTVYANVANVVDTNGDGTFENLYTNIYILSFNQDADTQTQKILTQVIDNWHFNSNVTNVGNCKNSNAVCVYDSDCSLSDYCESEKSSIIRDTKRLADLADIKEYLEIYKNKNGFYPKLESGSYLPNKTLSVWPSWSQTLSKNLGMSLPVDPVNNLGECTGFDEKTCWNTTSKQFATDLDAGVLPPDSFIYIYNSNSRGDAYKLCFIEETGIVGENNGSCPGFGLIGIDGEVLNLQPAITGTNLPVGYSGEPYSGFVEGSDNNNDVLTWTIDTSSNSWNLWSNSPIVKNTPVASQIEVYADYAGAAGMYSFTLSANDGAGEVNSVRTEIYNIKVVNPPPVLSMTNIEYVASTTNPLLFKLTAVDSPSNMPLSMVLLEGSIPPDLNESITINGSTSEYIISGIINPSSFSVPDNIDLTYKIKVTDLFGASAEGDFTIRLINNKPVFKTLFACAGEIRAGYPLVCQTGAFDIDGHNITYSMENAPSGLMINSSLGVISGLPTETGDFPITITATDTYGAQNSKVYILRVDSYCGDGSVQAVNSEGQEESCDDGNLNSDDACDNECKWTCDSLNNIKFDLGFAESMVYDNNPSPNTSNNVANGSYLKLSKSMETPYIWVANSYFYLEPCDPITETTPPGTNCAYYCQPGVDCSRVSKIRITEGYKKTVDGYDFSTWETVGQHIGDYNVGNDPSRTAVNAENGDVWVANRGSGNVTKLNIDGVLQKTCLTGPGPRGIAIEEYGDVWVGNYFTGNIVKLSGDSNDCTIKENVYVGGAPYGLAIDANNNVWISNRGSSTIQMLNTATLGVTTYNLPVERAPYGIAVDLNGDVWVADTANGYFKLDVSTGIVSHYTVPISTGTGNSRGVTITLSGAIRISFDYSNRVLDIPDVNNPSAYTIIDLPPESIFPIGIAGDSRGITWVVNYSTGNITGIDMAGNFITPPYASNSTFPVSTVAVRPYTYSDMTGINRSMLLRAGSWVSSPVFTQFDGGFEDTHWGKMFFDSVVPSDKQNIDIFLRADNFFVHDKEWVNINTWNQLPLENRVGRFIQIKIEMRSREQGITPVLSNLNLNCSI